MGNCLFKGDEEAEEQMIKVITSNGGIMELSPPITADCITNDFPGHAIYRSHNNLLSHPLLHNEELHAGKIYYLLPFNSNHPEDNTNRYLGRSTPNRHNRRMLTRSEAEQVHNKSSGVWKVKLVISPEQLAEILAQEARTEAFIESVRTVAKCHSGWKGSPDKYVI